MHRADERQKDHWGQGRWKGCEKGGKQELEGTVGIAQAYKKKNDQNLISIKLNAF